MLLLSPVATLVCGAVGQILGCHTNATHVQSCARRDLSKGVCLWRQGLIHKHLPTGPSCIGYISGSNLKIKELPGCSVGDLGCKFYSLKSCNTYRADILS
ncbi:hypothetical protein GOP47_0018566 [Adiantum capillus-veneris]|uniref:Secreted protein n=1 Tax=Adiantum capillus-veneris TaxID=13818 RepID=A0A9D4UDX9_ADICA|nr:hypothetical protein GOP47_0018566 [Adiantum capillus-veneris]